LSLSNEHFGDFSCPQTYFSFNFAFYILRFNILEYYFEFTYVVLNVFINIFYIYGGKYDTKDTFGF